jgi:hypothetical protein
MSTAIWLEAALVVATLVIRAMELATAVANLRAKR